MVTNSPIYSALEKILDIFNLADKIALYSYRDNFAALWEVDASFQDDKPILCVVDDSFDQFRWLPISVWGHYFRAKHSGKAAKLLLIGEETVLNPPPNRGALFIPVFYRGEDGQFKDTGLQVVTFWHRVDDFITQFFRAVTRLLELQEIIDQESDRAAAEQEFAPKEQMIAGWQGIIRNTLSLPERRHSISNEIAPIELRKALETLPTSVRQKKKLTTLMDDTTIAQFLEDLKSESEKRALLSMWQWVSPFSEYAEAARINKYRMQDIWGIWSKARFLIIDDQGTSQGFDKIVKCALALVMGKNYNEVNLVCSESILMQANELAKNYDCLFLDLRLSEKDQRSRRYTDLSGVRFAIEISEKCPAFPVIIFSSSQQREIDNYFSGQGNIISCFRKPGIAGSLQAIDGHEALDNLFAAIKQAIEMIENRLVYDSIPISQSSALAYKNYLGQHKKEKIDINRRDFTELFRQVFWFGRYDNAFTYPYGLFEVIFDKYELKWLEQIGIKGNPASVEVDNGTLKDKASELGRSVNLSSTKITKIKGNALTPADFEIEQWTPNLNLNLRVLSQLRNLYSHGIRNYDAMRREAIVALLLFFSILKGEKGSQQDFADVSDLELQNNFPLIFPCRNSDTKRYVREIFSLACYYGRSTIYNKMHALRVRNP